MTSFKSLFTGLLVCCTSPALQAVKIRVATFNVLGGIGESGESGRDNMEAVLARIDADIVGLQEVFSRDFSRSLAALQANLGYPYAFVPNSALDTQSRAILLSKYPFVSGSTKSITSPQGANDVTRASAAAMIDVPGTINDPVIVTAHLKCCFDADDPFRRAIEMIRIRKHLEKTGISANDNVFIMGDLNLLGNNQTYSSLPSGLPATYVLGNDILFNVQYYSDPINYFPSLGMVNPGFRHQNGVSTDTFMGSSTILDYLLVSGPVATRIPMTEVYNSVLDRSFPGLPKSGNPLPASTSGAASDHYPVYGDFELDGGLSLTVEVSPSNLDENSPAAAVTVTLETPSDFPTVVSLQSSDPCEARLTTSTLTIPAGVISATTTLVPSLDRIADGDQDIEVFATSDGFKGDVANVIIGDADAPLYLFLDSTSPVVETFDNFNGDQSLAAWTDGGINWRGLDDGSNPSAGARSYDHSLGLLATEQVDFTTTFRNDSPTTIEALSISFDAKQWRRFTDGSGDRWEVMLERNGQETLFPTLTFHASTDGPSGQITPPVFESKQAYARGFKLLPNEEFFLKLRAIPGSSENSASNDIFINEFHYDNVGGDTGEFVEISVGEAFTGDLSKVILHLYNGRNGIPYGTGTVYRLNSFVTDPTPPLGLPRFYTKDISGIQNGAPDGMALVIDGQVREFISYEGTFTATAGPAMGLTSTPIGVSQSASTQIGQKSLTRTGMGGVAEDFTWTVQAGPHTPGQANVGQTFVASPQPQGIAIDNLSIVPLTDQDGDLLSDIEEITLGTNPSLSDSDKDGQDDFFEAILAGTNPLNSASNLKLIILSENDTISVSVPSRFDRTYHLEFSNDLKNWWTLPSKEGNGMALTFEFESVIRSFFRIRISL